MWKMGAGYLRKFREIKPKQSKSRCYNLCPRKPPVTRRIEKTVFISYRRTNLPWSLAIYQDLTKHGFDVFFDYQSIHSGDFEQVIISNIKARAHFIVILTPSALERCDNPSDWL